MLKVVKKTDYNYDNYDNNYDKKFYIEYLNEIYYINLDILKEINKITFEDNFEYKYNYKYNYNLIFTNIKLRL
jgi:hypothetical protein